MWNGGVKGFVCLKKKEQNYKQVKKTYFDMNEKFHWTKMKNIKF